MPCLIRAFWPPDALTCDRREAMAANVSDTCDDRFALHLRSHVFGIAHVASIIESAAT